MLLRLMISNYPIFIYPRKGFDVEIPAQYPHIKKVDAPLVEISSTFIREAFKTGKDVRFFLPEAIRNRIHGPDNLLPMSGVC